MDSCPFPCYLLQSASALTCVEGLPKHLQGGCRLDATSTGSSGQSSTMAPSPAFPLLKGTDTAASSEG